MVRRIGEGGAGASCFSSSLRPCFLRLLTPLQEQIKTTKEEKGKTTVSLGSPALVVNPSRQNTTYNIDKIIDNGSFGVVFKATVEINGREETVAIKKVFQDKRYKNRELSILQELHHPNCIEMKHSFYTTGDKVSNA